MELRIEDVDKNFKIETTIQKEGLTFMDIKKPPFSVHGLVRESDRWARMPLAVANTVSPNVLMLARHTAGGRVRFVTDSPYIAIKTSQPNDGAMPHITMTGQGGFDLYMGEGDKSTYYATFMPPAGGFANQDGYESIINLREGDIGLHEYTINFPLYNGVKEIYVGLKEGSVLKSPSEYDIKVPVVFYGSSITQGGCASRPGTCYQAWLSRWMNADYINLGFSGSAKGEDEIADYIAGLDMSLFIYDYDYNAVDLAALEATHEKMFRKIREKHPTLPIIMASAPNSTPTPVGVARKEHIRANYEKFKAEGDENVYFIPGNELMYLCGMEGTVDGCHPTDLGFFSMAKRFYEEIQKIDEFRQ